MIEATTLFGEKKLVAKEKFYFRPAAYGLVVKDGKILLVRAKNTGKYWFPGGAVEIGETIEDALHREVREETGIEIKVEKFLKFGEMFFYYDPEDLAFQNIAFFYLCSPETTELIADELVDDGEAEKPRWVDLGSIKKEDFQKNGYGILDLIIK